MMGCNDRNKDSAMKMKDIKIHKVKDPRMTVEEAAKAFSLFSVFRHCTFCEKEIKDKEDISYTEDAEIAHSKCLQSFEQHWKDRDEALDLMGY